jgi:hypothetical protein
MAPTFHHLDIRLFLSDELPPDLNTTLDEAIQHSRIQGLKHTKENEAIPVSAEL